MNVVTAERLAKNPLSFVQNIRNVPNLALVSPQTSWILCSIAVHGLKNHQAQSLHVDASQTLGSRPSRTEPPREEPARTGRPLSTQHGRATKSLRLLWGAPVPARLRPLVGLGRQFPNTSSRQRSQQCGAPKRDRSRHRRSGEHQAQCCECSEKQRTTHFTSLPCHHIITPLHAPNHFSLLPFDGTVSVQTG